MRHNSTLLIGLLLVGAVRTEAATNSFSEKIKQFRSALVEVLVSGNRTGTGFCVTADGYIVTATHVVGTVSVTSAAEVVQYSPNLSVRFSDGSTASVVPVENPLPDSAFHDVTLLKADAKTPTFLPLGSPTTVDDGDDIYVMGFPLDIPKLVSYRGTVSSQFSIALRSPTGKTVSTSTIHVQIPVAKGFSGSPLLRMSGDAVLGVITNKLGGISPGLDAVRQKVIGSRGRGGVQIMGLNPNETFLELINTLDAFLSAGAGWAASIDYITPVLKSHSK